MVRGKIEGNRARRGRRGLAAVALAWTLATGCASELITLGRSSGGGLEVDEGGSGALGGLGSEVCESTSKTALQRPAALAFAFDVSGSMGRLDCPFWNHDPAFKWRPVVDATTAFFEDEQHSGLRASLTLFPSREDACSVDGYRTPDVPMTELPSSAFEEALRQYEAEVGLDDYADPMPEWGGTWRGGTPTHVAVRAVAALLDEERRAAPETQTAIVLVTDGVPAGCGDPAELLADVIGAVSDARIAGTLTYVIGVREPTLGAEPTAPWEEDGERVWACRSNNSGAWLWDYEDPTRPRPAPDTLSTLHGIAAAGGTERAFLIDTGEPDATRVALQTAIDAIRYQAIPCSLEIPEHPSGETFFDPEKVDVYATVAAEEERLPYDPECSPGGGWHYDSLTTPNTIELCPETCRKVEGTFELELSVAFLCERRAPTVK